MVCAADSAVGLVAQLADFHLLDFIAKCACNKRARAL